MKKTIKYIFLTIINIFTFNNLITPATFAASSGTNNACADGVPSEVQRAAGCSEAGEQETLDNSINIILNSIIGVAGFVAVVYIVIGGINYMTSAGDTNKLEKAKKTILYAVIGLVVCVLAFAIVNWVIGSIQGKK